MITQEVQYERRNPETSDHKSGRLESKRAWNIELEQALNEKTAELRQSQGRLRALASELSLAEQRARKLLANELHDQLRNPLALPDDHHAQYQYLL